MVLLGYHPEKQSSERSCHDEICCLDYEAPYAWGNGSNALAEKELFAKLSNLFGSSELGGLSDHLSGKATPSFSVTRCPSRSHYSTLYIYLNEEAGTTRSISCCSFSEYKGTRARNARKWKMLPTGVCWKWEPGADNACLNGRTAGDGGSA